MDSLYSEICNYKKLILNSEFWERQIVELYENHLINADNIDLIGIGIGSLTEKKVLSKSSDFTYVERVRKGQKREISVSSPPKVSHLQLAFFACLHDLFEQRSGERLVVDPIFDAEDKEVIEKLGLETVDDGVLGCGVLEILNEGIELSVESNIIKILENINNNYENNNTTNLILYMPHCEANLYTSVLGFFLEKLECRNCNRYPSMLSRTFIIGNPLSEYTNRGTLVSEKIGMDGVIHKQLVPLIPIEVLQPHMVETKLFIVGIKQSNRRRNRHEHNIINSESFYRSDIYRLSFSNTWLISFQNLPSFESFQSELL